MTARSEKQLGVVLLAAGLLLALAALVGNRHWFYDDAFISLRYARHLAQGYGPRWNLSGSAVEGFTSPLHVLLLALLLRLHVPALLAGRGVAFLSHAALLGYVWVWVRRRAGLLAAALAAFLVASSFSMLLWDLGGLEAVPFAALLTVGTLLLLDFQQTGARRQLWLGAFLLGVGAFVRLDGLVPVLVMATSVAVAAKGTAAHRVRAAAVIVGVACLCLLPWELFRMHTFHDVLPNTYYAKIVGIPRRWLLGSGRHYVDLFVMSPPFLLPLCALVALVQIVRRAVPGVCVTLWAWIATVTLYVVTSGGDHMFGFRFMITIVPVLAVALAMGLSSLGVFRSAPLAMGVVAAAVAACCLQLRSPLLNRPEGDSVALQGEVVGRTLARLPQGTTVALNAAGAAPYFADRLTFIDMFGLNDREIGHRTPMPLHPTTWWMVGHLKADAASVLQRRPDLIVLGPPAGLPAFTLASPLQSDFELQSDPEFAREYMLCMTPLPPESREQLTSGGPDTAPPMLTFYARRDGPLNSCKL